MMGQEKQMIIVVDDSSMILQQCREMLRNDYDVRTVNSAITLAKSAPKMERPPDLLLLDIEMPDMHGSEAIPEIRFVPGWGNVPIMLLTSWDSDVLLEQFFLADVLDVIHKPIIPSVFMQRIKNYLKLLDYMKGAKK
jgi:CheY-like chemotaxis protein